MKTYRFAALLTGAALALPVVALASAPENWENLCAKCHGADGKGDTKMGRKFKVQDLTTAEFQAKLDVAQVARMIREGDPTAKQHKKPTADELSEADAQALAEHIRALAAK